MSDDNKELWVDMKIDCEQIAKIAKGIAHIAEALSICEAEIIELLLKNGNITEDEAFYLRVGGWDMRDDIENLAIKFYDEITDANEFTHNDDEIRRLLDADYIVPMKRRGHFSITGKLIDLVNECSGVK